MFKFPNSFIYTLVGIRPWTTSLTIVQTLNRKSELNLNSFKSDRDMLVANWCGFVCTARCHNSSDNSSSLIPMNFSNCLFMYDNAISINDESSLPLPLPSRLAYMVDDDASSFNSDANCPLFRNRNVPKPFRMIRLSSKLLAVISSSTFECVRYRYIYIYINTLKMINGCYDRKNPPTTLTGKWTCRTWHRLDQCQRKDLIQWDQFEITSHFVMATTNHRLFHDWFNMVANLKQNQIVCCQRCMVTCQDPVCTHTHTHTFAHITWLIASHTYYYYFLV